MSSEKHGGGIPPIDDPFRAEDPATRERERRRLEREAKRHGRENRQSLASRVGGAIDAASSKGRERIEQTRERARSPEPDAAGTEPPPFRRPPAAAPAPVRDVTPPLDAEPPSVPAPESEAAMIERRAEPIREETAPLPEERIAPEVLMPRRESRRPPGPDTAEDDALAPEPIAAAVARQRTESEEWDVPPTIDPPGAAGSGGGSQPRVPPAFGGADWVLWRRRLLALAAIVAVVGGGAFALSKLGGGSDPAPIPAGPKKLRTTSVTIPEGLTEDEIAKVAKQAGLKGSYTEAAKQAAQKFNLQKKGAPKGVSLEGFLFPATYEVEKGAPASDLVDKQLTEGFDANFATVDLGYAKKKNLSVYDVVTIASMIEREVQVPAERAEVSAVIYNRLEQGIPLGIDATLRYALDNFDQPLTESDLKTDTPYNTRDVTGLPPTPIANPGLDSLKAAANPAKVDFLYYVVKPGTCGEHFFTNDYDEFLAASQKYDAAQAAAGGSPTDCG